MQPLVTVIVPTFNRSVALLPCLKSLLACEYVNYQIVVMDQSSPPVALPLTDARLKHVQLAIPGKSAALNNAVAITKADILLFTDDDCIVGPRWIARHVDV